MMHRVTRMNINTWNADFYLQDRRGAGANSSVTIQCMKVRWKHFSSLLCAFCALTISACDQGSNATPLVQRPASTRAAAAQHVLVISVDGLRGDALGAPWIEQLPAFSQLLVGPHTLQARCDPDISVTLPNHVGMATGRLFIGEDGHGWLPNIDPPLASKGGTLHATHDRYTASMFDVAHDAGARTGLFSMKSKFILFEQSYNDQAGAPSLGLRDAGRDKIDAFESALESEDLARKAIRFLHQAEASQNSSLAFLHFADPDIAGHGDVWELSPNSFYLEAIHVVDCALGEILAAIACDPSLRGRVAIILTSDHGGGNPPYSHTVHTDPLNFTIPFVVWNGTLPSIELYTVASTARSTPSASERATPNAAPPIRNADAGNTALTLLGLPAIPGSTVNARQDLLGELLP